MVIGGLPRSTTVLAIGYGEGNYADTGTRVRCLLWVSMSQYTACDVECFVCVSEMHVACSWKMCNFRPTARTVLRTIDLRNVYLTSSRLSRVLTKRAAY